MNSFTSVFVGGRKTAFDLAMPFCRISNGLFWSLTKTGNRQLFGTSCSCCLTAHRVKGIRKFSRFPARFAQSASTPVVISSSFSTSVSSLSSSNVSPSSSNSVKSVGKEQWDLYAGIVLERRPILTQKIDDMQQTYGDMLTQIEFEMSKKSDHEIRHENDLRMLEKVKKGEIELGNVKTARDEEDRWIAEHKSFTPASRETESDKRNDKRSLERALDSHLLLVVEQKLGKEYRWICPHSKLTDGETLRQAAERMIKDSFPNIKTKVLGNAPWGFYKYKYPKHELPNCAGSVGGKVFFYKAQVEWRGDTSKSKDDNIKDFLWLKRDELPDKLLPEYYKKLSECLIEE